MILIAESDASNGWLVLLMVLAGTTISLWALRRARRRRSEPVTRSARPASSDLGEAHALRGSLDTLMVQLEDFTRRMNAQLDTKCARLEVLLREADERIAQLEAANATPAPPTARTTVEPTSQIEKSANRATDALEGPTEDSDLAIPETKTLPNTPSADDTAHGRVFALADDGRTPLQIAKALTLPIGEVELLLQLRPFRQ